ncbi:XdhC family protein [Noviherbaspirillum sp.]|uniref:XdhC family protein n=1 Tax=Noviherbaspirillum sp. TaxID=1926288 RepID=UPI002FE001F9
MDSVDLEVLKACSRWVNEGRGCELVTVIRTWGSSPRPEGAMLAIRDDGLVVGSVSGGCIEDDLIDRVRRHGITRTHPELVTYGISADEAHRFGLPCGGTLQLAIEPVSAQSAIDALLERLARHELVARRIDLATGEVRLDPAAPGMTMQISETALTTIHGPRWRLLIIGAGQLSRFLAQIAVGMDYQVTVCDPREEYRDAWPVQDVTMLHAMPDDAVLDMQLDSRAAVVALTHDPKLDDLALMEALKSDAFYVGAIGSRANNAKRRERLKEFDLSDAQLAKLHGPVGLYIGSKTPAEIAISILAELTAAKNGVALPDAVRVAAAKEAQQPAGPDSGCAVP